MVPTYAPVEYAPHAPFPSEQSRYTAGLANLPPGTAMTPPPIDTTLLRSLAEIVSATGLTELALSKGDMRIRMVGKGTMPGAGTPPAPVPAVPVRFTVEDGVTVHSPMVGTVVRPARTGGAVLAVGSRVEAGDRLFLIEAMRTLTEVVARNAGTIRAILVGEGQPVEYGQPLLVLG